MECFKILEIEPTSDVSEIRSAYARLATIYHPEEEPVKFQQISKAFKEALRASEQLSNNKKSGLDTVGYDTSYEVEDELHNDEDEIEEPFYINLDDDLFYQKEIDSDYPVISEIMDKYRENEMDERAWSDYFATFKFLDVFREEGFAKKLNAMLKEEMKEKGIEELETDFLTALCIAYGIATEAIKVVNYRYEYETIQAVNLMRYAGYSEINYIVELLDYEKKPIMFRSGEEALRLLSVQEYFELIECITLSEVHQIECIRNNVRKYQGSYIVQKIPKRYSDVMRVEEKNGADRRVLMEDRLENSIVYLEHFCARYLNNLTAAKTIFNILGLSDNLVGSNKYRYENVKSIIIEKYPEVMKKEGDRLKAGKSWSTYEYTSIAMRAKPVSEDEKIRKETELLETLFADEDFCQGYKYNINNKERDIIYYRLSTCFAAYNVDSRISV